MKNRIKIIVVVAIAAITGITVYNTQFEELRMSSLTMENVEVIARGESDYHITCYYSGSDSSFRCKSSSCALERLINQLVTNFLLLNIEKVSIIPFQYKF